MLAGGELPDLGACLLLPEDVALRSLPPLKSAHKRLNFEQDRPGLSDVEEVRAGPGLGLGGEWGPLPLSAGA